MKDPNDRRALVALAIIALAVAFAVTGVTGLWDGPPGGGGFIFHYQGMLAGMLALVGAWFTVRAIRAQIDQAREQGRERTAAAREELEGILQRLNVMWRAVDLLRERTVGNEVPEVAMLRTLDDTVPKEEVLDHIEVVGEMLGPRQRLRWKEMAAWLRLLRVDWDRTVQNRAFALTPVDLALLATVLTQLRRVVVSFDPGLEGIFAGRQLTNIRAAHIWENEHQFLDLWAEQHPPPAR